LQLAAAAAGTAHARRAVAIGSASRTDGAGRTAAAAVGRRLVTVARAVGTGDLGALPAQASWGWQLLGTEQACRAVGAAGAGLTRGAAGRARASAVRCALALVDDAVVTAGGDAGAVLTVQRRAVAICHALGDDGFGLGFGDGLQHRATGQLRVARVRACVWGRDGLIGAGLRRRDDLRRHGRRRIRDERVNLGGCERVAGQRTGEHLQRERAEHDPAETLWTSSHIGYAG